MSVCTGLGRELRRLCFWPWLAHWLLRSACCAPLTLGFGDPVFWGWWFSWQGSADRMCLRLDVPLADTWRGASSAASTCQAFLSLRADEAPVSGVPSSVCCCSSLMRVSAFPSSRQLVGTDVTRLAPFSLEVFCLTYFLSSKKVPVTKPGGKNLT